MAPSSGTLGRRSFLGQSGATVVAATLPWPVLLSSRSARADATHGPLVRDPAGICDLPEGFSYTVLERTGDPMDDGYRVPGLPDGMACFPGPEGRLVLMRNHELEDLDRDESPYPRGKGPPPEAYDSAALGGVTRVVIDATSFRRVSSNIVLAGTSRNCAGGTSPWGWLTCEEIFDARHGYVFVCPTDAERAQPPKRIVGYGHFKHEAASVDPETLECWLTEDQPDGCLYRFVPDRREDPFTGRLMAMKIAGRDRFDTGSAMMPGERLPLEWVAIDDPDPRKDTLRASAHAKGAAIVRRGEGLWLHDGSVWFTSTSGGPAGKGQLFRIHAGMLELVSQSDDEDMLDGPDNVTVAPWGGVFVAEDGNGGNYVRGLTPEGRWFDFARNAKSKGEIAGVCFAPDGRAMFMNFQRDGLTLAITGPFERVRAPAPALGAGMRQPYGEGRRASGRGGCGCTTASSTGSSKAVAAALAALGMLALRRRARSCPSPRCEAGGIREAIPEGGSGLARGDRSTLSRLGRSDRRAPVRRCRSA